MMSMREPVYTPMSGKNAGIRNRRRIRDYMLKHPGATCVEISTKLKLSRQSVSKHLRTFMKK